MKKIIENEIVYVKLFKIIYYGYVWKYFLMVLGFHKK